MDRKYFQSKSCFLIAEAGVNHNGKLELAKRLVDTAQEAGANAVKFQTFKAEKLVSPAAPKAAYQIETTGSRESQLEMIRRLQLSFEDFEKLYQYCQSQKILFMSTPFDKESADFLDQLGMEIFKVPSGEVTNLPFLTHIARKGKPMILSTGMADLGEVEEAVEAVRGAGNQDLTLLHCTSSYPADPAEANLKAMLTLKEAFGLSMGYSDHTPGIEVSLAAAALEACVIEKHFTLDKNMEGPDHRMSLDPIELKAWVKGVRIVESSLGNGLKAPLAQEQAVAKAARRSLVAAANIAPGQLITEDLIEILRPGGGLPPSFAPRLIGRRAKAGISAGSLFSLEMFS